MFRWIVIAACIATPAKAQDAGALVTAARAQVGITTLYDPSYMTLSFPNGDVAADRGVCTDVVIRALRSGWGIDLQLAVNRDMKSHFGAYPAFWDLRSTDRNIDHRRVPNLQTLFTRIGASLPDTDEPYAPGDIVSFLLPGNLTHIGIVSDRLAGTTPMILHNIGAGTAEDDILFAYPITGHYRLTPDTAARLRALTD